VQGSGLASSTDGVAACSAGEGLRRGGGSARKVLRRSSQATRSRGEDVAAFTLGSCAGVRAACVGRRRWSTPARGVGGGEARLGGRRVGRTGTAAVSSSGVGRASQRLLGRGIFCTFAD
jgi:hypothetical protein